MLVETCIKCFEELTCSIGSSCSAKVVSCPTAWNWSFIAPSDTAGNGTTIPNTKCGKPLPKENTRMGISNIQEILVTNNVTAHSVFKKKEEKNDFLLTIIQPVCKKALLRDIFKTLSSN